MWRRKYMVTISACMIGKDEAQNLPRCIESIKGVVDEMIYLDTGSKDNSKKIAKSYGMKVYEERFENDFAKVRNKCKSYATGEWILSIDCDEELSANSAKVLREIVSHAKVEALLVEVVNMIGGKINDRLEYARLFKNKKEYVFEGKIHEQITRSITRIRGVEAIGECHIEILHYGYDLDKEGILKKHNRNLPILLNIEESKRDGFYYFTLGNQYASIGEYVEALKYYEKGLETNNEEDIYDRYLYERTMYCYYLVEKYEACINVGYRARGKYPWHLYYLYFTGMAYLQQMKFSYAFHTLVQVKQLLEQGNEKYGWLLEKASEINEILDELKDCTVPTSPNLVTAIVDCREYSYLSIDTLKSINEMSTKIFVLGHLDNDLRAYIGYENIGVDYRYNLPQILDRIGGGCHTEYVMYLQNYEGIAFEDMKKLVQLLENKRPATVPFFQSVIQSTEIRVVKNNLVHLLNKNTDEATDLTIGYISTE